MRLTLGKIGWGVVGTLFLMTPLFVSSARAEEMAGKSPAYNWAYAEEASSLLQEARSLSVQLAQDSHFLELQSRRNRLHWKSHVGHLNQIRRHINAMGEKLQRLQEIQDMLASWQQKTVERVMPNALALAARTEGAIAFLNEHQGNLWSAPYTGHISAMSEHAEEIKSTLSMFLDYGKTSEHLKGLESQLEFTGA